MYEQELFLEEYSSLNTPDLSTALQITNTSMEILNTILQLYSEKSVIINNKMLMAPSCRENCSRTVREKIKRLREKLTVLETHMKQTSNINKIEDESWQK